MGQKEILRRKNFRKWSQPVVWSWPPEKRSGGSCNSNEAKGAVLADGLSFCTAPRHRWAVLWFPINRSLWMGGGGGGAGGVEINWDDFLSNIDCGFMLRSGVKLYLKFGQAQNQLKIWKVLVAEKLHDWQRIEFLNIILFLIRRHEVFHW